MVGKTKTHFSHPTRLQTVNQVANYLVYLQTVVPVMQLWAWWLLEW